MRRALIASLFLAACGDNLDTSAPEQSPEAIEATCSETDIDALVAKLPGVISATKADCGTYVMGAASCYEVMIKQPVDHTKPDGPSFKQQLFVMHRGCDRPTVIADWGYEWRYYFDDEPATLLQANGIRAEHRYQGRSVPL